MPGFAVINGHLIQMWVSQGFNLEHKGVGVSLPKPLGAAELDVLAIDGDDMGQGIAQAPALAATLDAKRHIGNAVIDGSVQWIVRRRDEVMRIALAGMHKMAETALQCIADAKAPKGPHQRLQGGIDAAKIQCVQGMPPPLPVIGVIHETFGWTKCLHSLCLAGAIGPLRLSAPPNLCKEEPVR